MGPKQDLHDWADQRIRGHGLASGQLVDGEPDVRQVGLYGQGGDQGFYLAGTSPLRTGGLRTTITIWLTETTVAYNIKGI